jgi:ribosome-associated protein
MKRGAPKTGKTATSKARPVKASRPAAKKAVKVATAAVKPVRIARPAKAAKPVAPAKTPKPKKAPVAVAAVESPAKASRPVKVKQADPGLLATVLAQLDEAKAEAIVTINLEGKGAIADNMVVASGRSSRHVGAIADQLVGKLKEAGHKNLRIEGMPQCDWVLVDAGDILVHLFRPEVRSFYNLEKLWSEHTPQERAAL